MRTMFGVWKRKPATDRKSTRLNSSHLVISYAVFCLKKKKRKIETLVNIPRLNRQTTSAYCNGNHSRVQTADACESERRSEATGAAQEPLARLATGNNDAMDI